MSHSFPRICANPLLTLLFLLLAAPPSRAGEVDNLLNQVDWPSLENRARDWLQEYLRIDTTNPPGHESLAADFLESKLKEFGHTVQRLSAAPGRDNLLWRLKGNGESRAILLMGHSDVVGAEPMTWTHPPFDGVIEDGYLWGRGAIDTKSLTIIQLISLLELDRLSVPRKRDFILLVPADEETGGSAGVEWLLNEDPSLLNVEYVLDEGATGIAGLDLPVDHLMVIGTGEKGLVWIKLKTHGDVGHGSIPWKKNAVFRLTRAVSKLQTDGGPPTLCMSSRRFLEAILETKGLPHSDSDASLLNTVAALCPEDSISRRKLVGMASNTINATQLKSGFKVNVVPGEAEATIDCRLVPGTKVEDFVEWIRTLIDDPGVEIEIITSSPASESSPDTGLFKILAETVESRIAKSQAVPFLTLGGSDSRFFRNQGIPSYAFNPVELDEADFTAHQPNEKVSLAKLNSAVRIYL